MMDSLGHVEKLVVDLYASSNPARINEIQSRLLAAQHAHGWQLGPALLSCDTDQNVRFFGILSYMVKLNDEGSSLAPDALRDVYNQLIDWFLKRNARMDYLFVMRKLCSALVTTILASPIGPGAGCIRHLAYCLATSKNDIPSPDQAPSLHDTLPNIKTERRNCILLLSFATALADEITKIDQSQQFEYCHERIRSNLEDAVTVMGYLFEGATTMSDEDGEPFDCLEDLLRCYQSWINYGRKAWKVGSAELELLRQPFMSAAGCLLTERLFQSTAEFLIDTFSGSDSFGTSSDDADTFLGLQNSAQFVELLHKPWAAEMISRLESSSLEDDEDALSFAQLVCSFGQSIAVLTLKHPAQVRHITDMIHRITKFQSIDNVDQTLSNLIVDYWESVTSLAETVDEVDAGFGLIGNDWLSAIEELCVATTLPLQASGELQPIKQDDPFSEFRHRVRDAIQESYTTFGIVILKKLIELSIQAHENVGVPTCWPLVESVLNCLGGFSESMRYEDGNIDVEDACLAKLFSSRLFADITDFQTVLPTRIRKKAMLIMGEHNAYLGRHSDQLFGVLNFLYQCQLYPRISEAAARSILALCDQNRRLVSIKAEEMMTSASNMFNSGSLSEAARESIGASLAALAQARQEYGPAIVQVLLEYGQSHYNEVTKEARPNEELREQKLVSLRYLLAIGKYSQTPEERTADLDAVDTPTAVNDYSQVHQTLLSFVAHLVENSINDGEIFEAACDVFRTGYKETVAGPFVLPAEQSANFLMCCGPTHPRADVAVRTAADFVSSHSSRPQDIAAFLPRILQWLCTFCENTAPDPDITHGILDFLSRVNPRHSVYLGALTSTQLHSLFSLSITALGSPELLPKKAAAGLWVDLLSTPATSRNLPLIRTLLEVHGTNLTGILVFSFGGTASRSQLDWLSDPFRKLIANCSRYLTPTPWRSWAEAALWHAEFPGNGRVGDEEKRRFLKQVEMLRGGARTSVVVREFWAACRGTPVAY